MDVPWILIWGSGRGIGRRRVVERSRPVDPGVLFDILLRTVSCQNGGIGCLRFRQNYGHEGLQVRVVGWF